MSLMDAGSGSHCLGVGCDHDESAPRRASATPLRGRRSAAARRERLKPADQSAGQSSRPTASTRTTATPSSADASRSTSAVMPQS